MPPDAVWVWDNISIHSIVQWFSFSFSAVQILLQSEGLAVGSVHWNVSERVGGCFSSAPQLTGARTEPLQLIINSSFCFKRLQVLEIWNKNTKWRKHSTGLAASVGRKAELMFCWKDPPAGNVNPVSLSAGAAWPAKSFQCFLFFFCPAVHLSVPFAPSVTSVLATMGLMLFGLGEHLLWLHVGKSSSLSWHFLPTWN